MSANLRIFLEMLSSQNMVFILFFATIFPLYANLNVKQAFRTGLKYAIALAFSGLAALAVFSFIPPDLPSLNHVVVIFLAVFTARILNHLGELQGEFAGMPRYLLFILPSAGLQTYLWTENLHGLAGVTASFGAGLGLYIGIIILVAVMEQLKISEAPAYAKKTAALFFAIAILAIGFSGFQFL